MNHPFVESTAAVYQTLRAEGHVSRALKTADDLAELVAVAVTSRPTAHVLSASAIRLVADLNANMMAIRSGK